MKNERYTEEVAKTILRMKQERVNVDTIYHQITERINALTVVEGAATYAGFVNELNKRIDGYENTISIRRAKGKKVAETIPTAN